MPVESTSQRNPFVDDVDDDNDDDEEEEEEDDTDADAINDAQLNGRLPSVSTACNAILYETWFDTYCPVMNAAEAAAAEDVDVDIVEPNISFSCCTNDLAWDAKYCPSDLQPALTIAMEEEGEEVGDDGVVEPVLDDEAVPYSSCRT